MPAWPTIWPKGVSPTAEGFRPRDGGPDRGFGRAVSAAGLDEGVRMVRRAGSTASAASFGCVDPRIMKSKAG
jgi:hypothetical protein